MIDVVEAGPCVPAGQLVGVQVAGLGEGDRILLGQDSRAWTVQARDAVFVVATRVVGRGMVEYTVIAVQDPCGEVPAVVRSSVDTLGGGYAVAAADPGAGCRAMLAELAAGELGMSVRRMVQVPALTVL